MQQQQILCSVLWSFIVAQNLQKHTIRLQTQLSPTQPRPVEGNTKYGFILNMHIAVVPQWSQIQGVLKYSFKVACCTQSVLPRVQQRRIWEQYYLVRNKSSILVVKQVERISIIVGTFRPRRHCDEAEPIFNSAMSLSIQKCPSYTFEIDSLLCGRAPVPHVFFLTQPVFRDTWKCSFILLQMSLDSAPQVEKNTVSSLLDEALS